MVSRYKLTLPPHRVDHKPIRLNILRVSDHAQRKLQDRHWQGMANNWNPTAVGVLTVSYRDRIHWLVDGQHRRRAAVENGVVELQAEIHYGLSLRDEGNLFLLKNRENKTVGSLDNYNIGITAGDPIPVATDKVLKERGLRMGGSGDNCVKAVVQAQDIVELYGAETLAATLDVAEAAWTREASTWDGLIISGLGTFLGLHRDDKLDLAALIKKIDKKSARWWRAKINDLATEGGTKHSGSGSRPRHGYRLFLKFYNAGRSTTRLTSKYPDGD